MGLLQVEHTKARLTDTATDAERQGAVEQSFVEVELLAVFLSAQGELAEEGFLVHTDTHGREFHGAVEHVVPNQEVAVQAGEAGGWVYGAVVVIVGRAVVVLLAVAQLAADADDEHGSVFLRDGMFAFFRCEVGVALHEFFGVDEVDALGQEGLDLRIHFAYHVFGASHGRVDACHDLLEEVHGALFGGDGAFPVPLVHVEGVQVAQLLVGADGIHVSVDAVAGLNAVFGQGEAFPLGQRVYHFGLRVAQILDGEGYGAFHSVEVVVDTHALQYEEGCGNTAQAQLG